MFNGCSVVSWLVSHFRKLGFSSMMLWSEMWGGKNDRNLVGQLRSTNSGSVTTSGPSRTLWGCSRKRFIFTGMRRTVKAKRVLLIVQSPSLSIGAVNYGLWATSGQHLSVICAACELFKWLKKYLRTIFCDVLKFYEVQISVSITKVDVLSMAASTLQWQRWVVF